MAKVIQDVDPFKSEKEGRVREVGNLAVWSLSSCKPGFGVDQLRDPSLETYWQSDGPQPHTVNIQFRRKMTICDICIFADIKADESYTPNKLSIRAGNHVNDLTELDQVDLVDPSGWVIIPIKTLNDQPVRAFMIQIAVISNHQNGRDTHMRHIKIHCPAQDCKSGKENITFSTREMNQWFYIR